LLEMYLRMNEKLLYKEEIKKTECSLGADKSGGELI